jgi:predicted  nucleic acid-binding Zn-ribbon protein
LKEGLEKLYALQQLDDRIHELEASLKETPEIVKKLEQERDGKATIIENTRTKLTGNVKAREKLEKDILLVKEKIKKYKDQMSKATTNKEYQGFMAEIKYEEENIESIEEKVIEKMVESDEIMKEIRESEAEFQKIAEEYDRKIKTLKHTVEAERTNLVEVKKSKVTARTEVEPRLLAMYDNISKKYGKAVSLVESEFCGVCNVKIRLQHFNELISTRDVSMCESCGRILFKKPEVQKEDSEDD